MRRLLVAAILASVIVGGSVTEANAAGADGRAASTTFHVDCSRSQNGDGRGSPWNSLAAVNAHGAFSPGDRVLLRRGTSCHGRLRPTGSGTASAPIVLGAYGTGSRPTIAGDGTPDRTAAVTLTDVEHWTVQDLRITNHGKSLRTTHDYRSGLLIVNTGVGRLLKGILVQRLRVVRVVSAITLRYGEDSRNWGGISLITYRGMTRAHEGFDRPVIRDSVVDHVGRTGIVITNRSWPKSSDLRPRITGNRVSWARSDSILLRGASQGRIDHNVSARGADMFPCPECGPVDSPGHASVAIWTAQSRDVRIDHNEVYGNRSKGGDGEAFDADRDAFGTVIEYNYAHNNEAGAVFFCGSTGAIARFNIFQNNGASDIAFIGNYPATRTRIYNNTIYHAKASKGGIVRFFNGKSGRDVRFYNNIVYSYGKKGTYSWPMPVWSRANTYIGTHRAGEPRGKGFSLRDPGLRAPGTGKTGLASLRGYRPSASRSIAHGMKVPKAVTKDFFGNTISWRKPPRGAIAR